MSRRGISIPLCVCGSGVRGIPPVRWGARGFRVRPVPSELWRGRAVAFLACCLVVGVLRVGGGGLSPFSVLLGGLVFCVWGGGGLSPFRLLRDS